MPDLEQAREAVIRAWMVVKADGVPVCGKNGLPKLWAHGDMAKLMADSDFGERAQEVEIRPVPKGARDGK